MEKETVRFMKKYIILLWLALVANVVQGQQIVRQVQTLADLANVADGFQSLYNVQYGYTEGDGLGGVFFYDSNGVASTNIFNVIDSNIIAGQWVRSETSQKELRLGDANNSNYTGFQSPSVVGANTVYTLPSTDGAAGTVLSTDGALGLTWSSAASLSSDTLASISGTKLVGPALYFDGSSSVVTVAHDAKQHFNNGTDDLPFSISFWVNTDFAVAGGLVAKYQSGAKEFVAWVTGSGLRLNLSDGTDEPYIQTASLTAYSNKWTHVTITSEGAGPNYSNDFPAAIDSLKVYVAAVDITSGATKQNEAAYGGLNNSSAAITLMSFSGGNFKKGSIRGVKIFNRELTATEVAELARGNDLGFSDEWGDQTTNLVVDGDMEDSGTADWTANAVTLSKPTVDPQQAVRNIKAILNGGVTGYFETAAKTVQAGKRYRAKFYYRTGGTSPTAYSFRVNGGSWQIVSTLPDQASWTYHEVEFVVNSDTTGDIAFHINSGTDASTFIEVDNFEVFSIGTLADFRAERYDTSTNKLYDMSDNAFVGIGTDVTLTGREVPVYETGTWAPSITFGGGSTGITYTTQEGHYTRYGNWVSVHAYILLSAKGSDTGTALIAGLPFTAINTAASSHSLSIGNMANAANLTSAVTAYATDNGTTINLVDWGATGSAVLDDTNFGATTAISVTGTYQIQ